MYNIIAKINISDSVPTPKSNGIKAGYSPHHKFKNVDYLVSGFHDYGDDLLHFPGGQLEVKIAFPSWEYFGSDVRVGDCFEVREINRIVGIGVVEVIA